MGWLEKLAIHRAAARYAKLLPDLRTNYGAAQFYTSGQVDASIRRRRLAGRYVALAYAAFLTEEDFSAVSDSFPRPFGYKEARKIVTEAWPGALSSAYHQDPMSNADAASRYGGGGL